MKLYSCKLLNKKGYVEYHKIFADSIDDLTQKIKDIGLETISISHKTVVLKNVTKNFAIPFFKNLQPLIENKINLIESLKITKKLFKDEEVIAIIQAILQNLANGMSFSSSLKTFNQFFDNWCIKTIEISEQTADLPTSLTQIVNHMEEHEIFVSRIKNSMKYPIMLVIFISIVFLFWFFFLVPQFANLFHEINVTPPLISRCIIACSNFAIKNLYILLSTLSIAYFGIFHIYLKKYRNFRLKDCVFKSIKITVQKYNFFNVMATLLQNKVNLIEALECCLDITPKISKILNDIKSGSSLQKALRKYSFLNEFELSIISTGEISGNLSFAFKTLSDLSKTKAETAIRKITTNIQPTVIIILGVILIIFVIAMIIPLYSNISIT